MAKKYKIASDHPCKEIAGKPCKIVPRKRHGLGPFKSVVIVGGKEWTVSPTAYASVA